MESYQCQGLLSITLENNNTYNVEANALVVVPLVALVTTNHVGLVCGPAQTVELDRQNLNLAVT